MRHDGLYFRKDRRLGWRHGNPDIDLDSHGEPVQSNYVAIVRIKDCEIYERDGRKYYNATNAPVIPITYGGTYYGYGKWKKRKSTYGKWVENHYVHEYWQCTTYLVHDAIVYAGSIQRIENPVANVV